MYEYIVSAVMKPKPLSELNHFTVPVSIINILLDVCYNTFIFCNYLKGEKCGRCLFETATHITEQKLHLLL